MRITSLTSAAKSAKGKLALVLFSGLAVFGATTVLGAPKPSFTVTATPAVQTVTQGQNATYTVAINRQNKHTASIAMSVISGLPAYTTATFSPQTVPGSGNTSSLLVKTNMGGTTPAGGYTLTIRGSGGGVMSNTTARLSVVEPAEPNFALAATPARTVISAEDTTSHAIGISRSGGFEGPVALSTSGLPNGVSAAFDPNPVSGNSTTLTFTSDHNPKPGTYTITVTGNGFAPAQLTRSTSVVLTVEEKRQFQITGDATQGLLPGLVVPLELTLTNPHGFPLQVTEVAVDVEHATSKPGCDGSDNYSVQQVSQGEYPLTLPANSSRTLTQLSVARPTVTMNDLANTSQDACKGATVFFNYSGAATK